MYFKCILFFALFYCVQNRKNTSTIMKLRNYFRKPIEMWSSKLEITTELNWDQLLCKSWIDMKSPTAKALVKSNCPRYILKVLLEKSNEYKWPLGLSTAELRHANKSIIQEFICRRIPGANAAIMVPSDNYAIPAELKAKPALLFVFTNYETTEGS